MVEPAHWWNLPIGRTCPLVELVHWWNLSICGLTHWWNLSIGGTCPLVDLPIGGTCPLLEPVHRCNLPIGGTCTLVELVHWWNLSIGGLPHWWNPSIGGTCPLVDLPIGGSCQLVETSIGATSLGGPARRWHLLHMVSLQCSSGISVFPVPSLKLQAQSYTSGRLPLHHFDTGHLMSLPAIHTSLRLVFSCKLGGFVQTVWTRFCSQLNTRLIIYVYFKA